MSDLPDLLRRSCDAGHRCHLRLNPNAHSNPPPVFVVRTIKNRFLVNGVFEEHLTAHGLLPFSKPTSSKEKFTLDPSLLSALVDRWRPETHTFHLSCGELTPTLKDVSMITALPIKGTPLVPAAYSSIWPTVVQDRLGVGMPATSRGGSRPRGVPLSWLVNNFQELPAEADAAIMSRHLFAPIYGFGSAMLAYTYRGLCDATKKTRASSKGHILAPYNPERVMRQFGKHQDIPPPSPRRLVADVHL
ncbi:serine/threonine-protein phosphatase 7 long form homolog [Lolium rigidum]|uniref:serine/threonine-protein phosphatase 7 long form homolog n=1 Tax=Lolium rigidum TaxID=89674 RepID=UPI001F5D4828|nr:serine/threonine-protein phosphatase 7 long form homolog [Lolium rigidum]